MENGARHVGHVALYGSWETRASILKQALQPRWPGSRGFVRFKAKDLLQYKPAGFTTRRSHGVAELVQTYRTIHSEGRRVKLQQLEQVDPGPFALHLTYLKEF